METRTRYLLSAAAIGACAVTANAAPVMDWHTLRGTTATVISGENTNDPVVGTIETTSAGARVLGYFSPVTLSNIGDKVTLTYTVSFNDATGMVDAADNFRYALFSRNGENTIAATNTTGVGTEETDGLIGYWFGIDAGTGAQGSMRERFDNSGVNQDPFANATATLLGTAMGGNVDFQSSVNGDNTGALYTGVMTLELQAGGLQLSGSFTGNATGNTFSFLEPTPIATTFDVVGILNGGNLSADQMLLQDVDVTYVPIPEPASLGLLLAGGLLALRRR